MRHVLKVSLACLAAGFASACKTADLVHPTAKLAYAGTRFINAVPDSSGVFGLDFRFVDIVENSAQYHMTFRNTPSQSAPFTSTATEYKGTQEGIRHFRVFLDDTLQNVASVVLADSTVTLVAGHNYTGIEWGAGRQAAPNNMHFSFWEDAPADPGAQVALRVLNTTGAAVDVRVYLAPIALATAQATAVTFANVAPYSTSNYVNFAVGSYVYDVVPAGAAVTAANLVVPDGTTLAGSAANCDGLLCAPGQHADIDATAGTTVGGSAVTGVIFPKSTAPEPAPGAPVATLAGVGAGSVDNGSHTYRVTFVTKEGETQGGTVSAPVVVVNNAVNGKVLLSGIPTGSALVTGRNIYRATGLGFQLVTSIADNTTTTYTDNSADATLSATLVPASNSTIHSAQFAAAGMTFMWDRRPPRLCDPYC